MSKGIGFALMQTIIVAITAFLSITIYVHVGGEKVDKTSKYREVPVAEYIKSEPEHYTTGGIKWMLAEFKIDDSTYKIRMDEDDNKTLVAGAKYSLTYRTKDKVLRQIDMVGDGDESVSK